MSWGAARGNSAAAAADAAAAARAEDAEEGAEGRAESGAEERAELERAENTLYESHRFIIDFALARTAAHSPHSPHPLRLLLLSDSAAFRRAAQLARGGAAERGAVAQQ